MRRLVLTMLLLGAAWAPAAAQQTLDLGLPPPSGSQNPVLPPPSGSQNPILPPQSGQRYAPGVGGPFRGNDIPGLDRRHINPSRFRGGVGEIGRIGDISPEMSGEQDRTIDTLAEIAPALRRCWQPPPLPGDLTGAMVSLRFSLRRDGTLFGQPRVTWETRRGDVAFQKRFSDSAIAAVHACTPMRLSKGLGAGIAGRPFTIRFHGHVPLKERQS
jgi:hypothetical protein